MAVITRPHGGTAAADGLAPAHRPAGGGPRRQRRASWARGSSTDPHDASRSPRATRPSLPLESPTHGQTERRHLHRQGGRHRPAPADQWAGIGVTPRLVARMAHASPTASGRTGPTRSWSWTRAAETGRRWRRRHRATRPASERWTLAWSPDGTSLIFPTRTACRGRFDLFIVAADGSSPATRLLARGRTACPRRGLRTGRGSPSWARSVWDRPRGLYVADVGPGGALAGGLQATSDHRARRGPGNSLGGHHNGHPTGRSWLQPRDECRLHRVLLGHARCHSSVKADGSGQRAVAERPQEYNPTWSPDGKQLAFHRIVDASEWVLGRPCTMATWVVRRGRYEPRRLDGLLADGFPAATLVAGRNPTGGSMVELIDGLEHFHLLVVSADGSNPIVSVDPAGTRPGSRWRRRCPAPSFAAASPVP